MIETFQLIFQIIQWVGSLFGLIAGIILIMRFFKERPIIKTKFYSTHRVNKDDGTTFFEINLDIDNIGDKPTSIKKIIFAIDKIEEDARYLTSGFEDFKMFNLNPRSSIRFSEEIIMYGYFDEETEIKVYIDHTHGVEENKVQSLFPTVYYSH